MQPQEGHLGFQGTTQMIEAAAADKPAFFKDMAYYVSDVADDDFMKKFTSTFIIRDPPSPSSCTTSSTPSDSPRDRLRAAVQAVRAGREDHRRGPAVVDAEDLLIDAASVVKQYCERSASWTSPSR